jgi:SAM-dependent methyltransferase
MSRYDGIADWYDTEFLGDVHDPGRIAALELLGPGRGRLLDLGCGTGAQTIAFRDAGWDVTGLDSSEDMLRRARDRGLDVMKADASALPFEDESFDAAVSLWTHTDVEDVDDFMSLVAEAARVVRPEAPFVYVGGHPCFVGPHSRFRYAKGIPELYPGYRPGRRYDDSEPGVFNPEGLRAKVGATHVPLGEFVTAFAAAGLRIERFEELGEDDYPYLVAIRARR